MNDGEIIIIFCGLGALLCWESYKSHKAHGWTVSVPFLVLGIACLIKVILRIFQ